MEEEDEGGGNGKPSEPPDELLRMFLGRRDGDLSEGRSMTIEEASTSPSDDGTRSSGRLLEDIASPLPEPDKAKALDSFYADPSRPLICAFNYPAVALTLGPQLWESHLRSTYLWLATSRDFNVRRTLAASIGELATIMGPERAERDLVTVWRNVVRSEEEDVRMKVVDCLLSFVGAVRGQARAKVLKDVLGVWQDGGWKSWREREGIARGLKGMVAVLNDGWNDGVEMDIWSTVRGLLKCACWDGVSAVREGAIDAVGAHFHRSLHNFEWYFSFLSSGWHAQIRESLLWLFAPTSKHLASPKRFGGE
jgi:serine/threonine-protein phosphatase 4 regulatory subunit 1